MEGSNMREFLTNLMGLTVCLVIIALPPTAAAKGAGESQEGFLLADPVKTESGRLGDWPRCSGILATDEIVTMFDSYGNFGRFTSQCQDCNEYDAECGSFMSPPGSGVEYLYAGGIWFGGIVNGDTLVTTGSDGWDWVCELYPTNTSGTVRPIESPADYALRAEYADTTASSGHTPMHIKVAVRGHVWRSTPYDNNIVYDVLITNIGDDAIEEGWVGIYMDGDASGGDPYGYEDDMVGSFRDHAIGYIHDDDGDPVDGSFTDKSPTRLFGLRLLETSLPQCDTNFNWWISSSYAGFDVGPMLRENYRDFGAFGTGTPIGDRNKYHVLSAPEWDFDAAYMYYVDTTVWMPLYNPPFPDLWRLTRDVKMLLSVGTVDLMPDSSVRVIFSLFTGADVHTDPGNFGPWPNNPDAYVYGLDFTNARANALAADSLAGLLSDPLTAVTGLAVSNAGPDSITISWDPWVGAPYDGHVASISTVPRDTIVPYRGVIPPWYQSATVSLIDTIGTVPAYTLIEVDAASIYFLTASRMAGGTVGSAAMPVRVDPLDRGTAPSIASRLFTAVSDPLEVTWMYDSPRAVDSFRIYRFEDLDAYERRYHAFYDNGDAGDFTDPRDSFNVDGQWYYYYALEPLVTVSGADSSFIDGAPVDDAVYAVAAVDQYGFESEFSGPARTHLVPPISRDVLVIASGVVPANLVNSDSVVAFYTRLLSHYDWDYVTINDSILGSCPDSSFQSCLSDDWLMQYRCVILDDGVRDRLYAYLWEDSAAFQDAFDAYAASGGKLVNFGNVLTFSPVSAWHLSPGWYDVSSSWLHAFGVDDMYTAGILYCDSRPCTDTVLGFSGAEPVRTDLPLVMADEGSDIWAVNMDDFWVGGGPPYATAFSLAATPEEQVVGHEAIYRFQSNFPALPVAGETCGIRTVEKTGGLRYMFGFHLYYMQESEAGLLIDWIMNDKADTPTDLPSEDNLKLPQTFSLHPNYPNPFNPATTISFDLPQAAQVRLEIFNILGRRVATLVDGEMPAGAHMVEWNSRNESGERVSSGVYFYRVIAGDDVLSKKMLLLK